jgi:hypothetical protein
MRRPTEELPERLHTSAETWGLLDAGSGPQALKRYSPGKT